MEFFVSELTLKGITEMDDNDELPQDLADAVKKSWSESTETSIAHYLQQSNQNIDSPIGTPINYEQDNNKFNRALMGFNNPADTTTRATTHMSNEIIAPKPQGLQENDENKMRIDTIIEKTDTGIPIDGHDEDTKVSSYHLLRHHYSISEDKDSASNLLQELELSNFDDSVKSNVKPELKQPFNLDHPTSLHHQLRNPFENSDSGILPIPVIPNNTKRRGSIQEVQWIRQYLNPRSSFSGASSNEPLPIPTSINKIKNKVTIQNSTSTHSHNNSNSSHNLNFNLNPNNNNNMDQTAMNIQNDNINSTSNMILDQETSNRSTLPTDLKNPGVLNDNNSMPLNTIVNNDTTTNTTGINNNGNEMINKCWVTTVDNTKESMQMVLVLCYSLTLNNSKFPIFVLYDENTDVTPLRNCQVNLVPIFKNEIKLMSPTVNINSPNQDTLYNNDTSDNRTQELFHQLLNKNWFILSLFISFVNSNYDLICYISPSCLIVDNIDELLVVESINNEIDNETCVLLTNVIENNQTPQLIIIKPNEEVAMCIKEYLTIYSDDCKERYEKINKLLQMNDMNILHELFGDTWGQISSEGYVKLLHPNNESINMNYCKILDFKNIKPWLMDANSIVTHNKNNNESNSNNNSNNINNDSNGTSNSDIVIQKWHEIWLEIWSIFQKHFQK